MRQHIAYAADVHSGVTTEQCVPPYDAKPFPQCFIVLQRPPCALDNGASTTVSTQEEHDALLLFISELADNIIRAQLLNDTAAAMFLTGQVPDSLFVQSAELTPECYK
jgi:hypothetical protein